jgi:hypothetical protein
VWAFLLMKDMEMGAVLVFNPGGFLEEHINR